MKRHRYSLILIFLFLAPFSCGRPVTDEERLQSQIETVRVAATEKDIGTIKEFIAPDYRDSKGRGIEEVHAIMAYFFFHMRHPSVVTRQADVSVDGETAQANVTVLFADRKTVDPSSALLPEYAAVYQFEVGFVKRKDRWWVMEALWKRLGAGGAP